jgi:hypothetical protein
MPSDDPLNKLLDIAERVVNRAVPVGQIGFVKLPVAGGKPGQAWWHFARAHQLTPCGQSFQMEQFYSTLPVPGKGNIAAFLVCSACLTAAQEELEEGDDD